MEGFSAPISTRRICNPCKSIYRLTFAFYMDCTTTKKATAALISHVVGIEPFNMVSWAHLGYIVGGFWGFKS